MTEKISIIIPVYNVEKYLKECLNSVISQTYNNLEIIVVDDGSTDSSSEICDAYEKKDSRIKVIHQKNMGLSGARNTGLDIVTGKYIMFLDSDDYLNHDAIENLLVAIKKSESNIAIGGIEYCNEKGAKLFEENVQMEKVYEGEEQIYKFLTTFDIPTMTWGKLYTKEIFDDIKFPLGKYHEDMFTTHLLLNKSRKTIIVPQIVIHYRQVPSSIMNRSFSLKHLDSIEAMKQRIIFLNEYYPKYVKYDYSGIPYICGKVFERIILADFFNEDIEREIQKDVQKYLWYFLCYSPSKLTTKLFCVTLAINRNLCRKLYKLIRGE